mgnify:CR=1 FL=1
MLGLLDAWEKNQYIVNKFKGEIFCSGYGIWIDYRINPQGHRRLFEIMERCDGERTVADIASELNIPFQSVWEIAALLAEKDLVVFTRQFSTMIDAGVPIVQCLDILLQQESNRSFKLIIKQVKGAVEAGATFSEALRQHPKVFDALFVNLVAAGELGGILDTILQRLAAYIEKNAKLVSKVKGAISHREGMAITTLGWVAATVFGALPFYFSGVLPQPVDCIFETISGFTTTGASVIRDVEIVAPGILFWRSLTHWLGGLGIIVLGLAILPFLGVGGMQLYKAEVPGPAVDKLKPRLKDTAMILWKVYMAFTVAETILLLLGGMNLLDALCHTFGTLATDVGRNRVRAVQVWLLTRSQVPMKGRSAQAQAFVVGPHRIAANDGFKRSLFTSMIAARNPS